MISDIPTLQLRKHTNTDPTSLREIGNMGEWKLEERERPVTILCRIQDSKCYFGTM